MPPKVTLQIRFSPPSSLLSSYQARPPTGALFVPSKRTMTLGEAVTVVIEFPSLRRTFRLSGRVVSARRGSTRPALPAGVEIEFTSDQRNTLQMVLDSAEGKSVDFVDRKATRVPCEIEVTYRTDEDFAREFTEDISEGGTFVRTQRKLPVGTLLDCRLKPPGYLLGVKLRCRVAWLNDGGSPRGMGVEFIFSSERQRAKIRKLIERLTAAQADKVHRGVAALKRRKHAED